VAAKPGTKKEEEKGCVRVRAMLRFDHGKKGDEKARRFPRLDVFEEKGKGCIQGPDISVVCMKKKRGERKRRDPLHRQGGKKKKKRFFF